ncbi:MAG: alpha/beta hydrolase [Variovorax sp.]|nr:MAG: alpha/beta hydrolase [Variovorax sp.]
MRPSTRVPSLNPKGTAMKVASLAWLYAFAATIFTCTCFAQVPAEIGEKLKVIGRTVEVTDTARLYEGRVLEFEPHADMNVERDLRYGPYDENLLDVFATAQKQAQLRPVLVYVPGGGYINAVRRIPDSAFFDNLMVWAVRNGMIGVSMSYRVMPKNAWPAAPEDVGVAVQWIREQIVARGGDPKRIFLMGHSSGAAHVASYVADERFHKARGSGLAGALMLSGFYRLAPKTVGAPGPRRAYFGDDVIQYEERSAQRGLLTRANQPPLMVGFAELDPPPTESQAVQLNDALCKAGHCPTFVRFAGHSHMSEMFSIGTADHSISDSVLAFTRSH